MRHRFPEEEIRGTIYLLTYSEQQNSTCITTYVVPMEAFQVLNLAQLRGGGRTNYGPAPFSARLRRLRKTASSTCMPLNI